MRLVENFSENGTNLSIGISNPKELGAHSVALYECAGKVYSVGEFISKYKQLLHEHEQHLIEESEEPLSEIAIPEELKRCLTRSQDFANSTIPSLIVKRSGGRSAYWPEHSLKFKGCRPVADAADFPIEILPFGVQEIEYSKIPFGTTRPEGVMRELLAYCFLTKHNMPVHGTPICIYEYRSDDKALGCCLVSMTKGEKRVEELVEYPDCTIQEIIDATHANRESICGNPIGAELKLRDLNIWWYVEEKSKLLSTMHFMGGFRGILNSNIGNDVLVDDETGGIQLYLCDFDTFKIIRIPDDPNESFIDAFVLQCIVEVAKGSISIFEYVDIPEKCGPSQIADILGEIYFEKNSLWRAHKRRFYGNAKMRGWNLNIVENAFEEMRRTKAFANIVSSCVLNSHYLREMSPHRNIYYPHN